MAVIFCARRSHWLSPLIFGQSLALRRTCRSQCSMHSETGNRGTTFCPDHNHSGLPSAVSTVLAETTQSSPRISEKK